MRTQSAKWATVVYQIAHHALSHVSRARFFILHGSCGYASLHPRLYASTRYPSWRSKVTCAGISDNSKLISLLAPRV